MIGIMMCDNKSFYICFYSHFHSLFPGAVSPAFKFTLILFPGILPIMNQQVCIPGKFNDIGINSIRMFKIGAYHQRNTFVVQPETIRAAGLFMELRNR